MSARRMSAFDPACPWPSGRVDDICPCERTGGFTPWTCPNANKSACGNTTIPPRRLFRHHLHPGPALHPVGHRCRGRRPRRPERSSLAIRKNRCRNAAGNRENLHVARPGPLCHHAESYPYSAANGRSRARQWAGNCPCVGDGGRAVEDAGPYKFTVSCADIDNETLYEQTMRRRALAAILSRARGPGRRGLPPDLGIHRLESCQMGGGSVLSSERRTGNREER